MTTVFLMRMAVSGNRWACCVKKGSDYTITLGAWTGDNHQGDCGWWWLRSPNLVRSDVVHMVRFDGRIYSDEFYPGDEYGGIVPAIKITMK